MFPLSWHIVSQSKHSIHPSKEIFEPVQAVAESEVQEEPTGQYVHFVDPVGA